MRSLIRRTAILFAAGASLGAIAIALPQPAAAQASAAATDPWGATITDVTADPAIKLGRLSNGMRYAIMKNEVPKGAASVRLSFDFGSIGESDTELGLAHFLEHMAFNGSKNVPEGEMIKILERQGLKFGPDTNASTGFDRTTYMLELPKADKDRLDTSFMLMREVASNLTFSQEAVNRERGVILGERRFRDTFSLRDFTSRIGFFLPSGPYASRLPIGTPEVIQNATAAQFKSIYDRYYRPEYATFVFVGDADPAEIERRIVATFGDWKGAGTAGNPLARGSVDLKRTSAFKTFVDPAVADKAIIQSYRPWANPADSRADRRQELTKALATAIFDRRMSRIINAPGSVVLQASMDDDATEDVALEASLLVVTKDGAWDQGLAIGEQELRRALKYGYSQAELDLERADYLGKLRNAAQQAGARTSPALSSWLVSNIGENDILTTPAWSLDFFQAEGTKISLDEVNAALREMWSGSAPLVYVSSKSAITDAQVASAYGKSATVAVAAPKAEKAITFAYDDWGKPGVIASDRRVDDLGVRTVRFANNVMLNLKRTDFEPGKVAYTVRMAGGSAMLPRDKAGAAVMLTLASTLAGTAKQSYQDIETATVGRQVQPGIVAGSDAFIVQGSVTADDLPLQMKLSNAYLTDFGFRPEADAQWQNISAVIAKQFEAQPATLLDARLPYLLANEDGRFGFPGSDQLSKRSLADVAPVLKAQAASAPIEITIVGDISEQAAIDAVAQSFGALPKRRASSPIDPALTKVGFRPSSLPIALTHSGDDDQAVVGSAWHTDDNADYRTEIGLDTLSAVLDLMLTDAVRERLGASYGVSTGSEMSDVFDGFGYLTANTVVSPTKMGEVEKAIADAAKQLRDKPIDADLLLRAKAPMLEEIAKNRRQNGYWLNELRYAQSRPDQLDRLRKREALVRAITAADIQALAQKYLTPERLVTMRVVSAKVAQTAVAPKG